MEMPFCSKNRDAVSEAQGPAGGLEPFGFSARVHHSYYFEPPHVPV